MAGRRDVSIQDGRDLPLSALLSQALVAFTIEFDNEFERQMPHRTTRHSAVARGSGPWLVSMVMWTNCMRFVSDAGMTVAQLEALARTPTNLTGMERWGYILVEPNPDDARARPSKSGRLIRATVNGSRAQSVWRPLAGAIEARWQARFGEDAIHRLRGALRALVSELDAGLPDCLPILGYGLFSTDRKRALRPPVKHEAGAPKQLDLPALLARALLAFAIDFEEGWPLSLATSASVVRILDQAGVLVRNLPRLTGVSKEAIHVALGLLVKGRLVTIGTEDAGRAKIARLTRAGLAAKDACRQRIALIEQGWESRFGASNVHALRDALAPLVGGATAASSPLCLGLEPCPDGWRASVERPQTLPHYPMVLHRGGFPDGS